MGQSLLKQTRAILFDRDATLIEDVPYNGDPALVKGMPGVGEALTRCRDAGLLIGVVTNQSAVGRGLITLAAVDAIAAEIERQFGRFDVWRTCPHAPEEGCPCRKPAPGLILSAAEELGLDPAECVVIGDRHVDVYAAAAAGAASLLVPSEPMARPMPENSRVADGLIAAVAAVIEGLVQRQQP